MTDTIRKMQPSDWDSVANIYKQGIEDGTSTFNRECPPYCEWDEAHLSNCRYVYEIDGVIVGWLAVSPVSKRIVYSGCVEESIYIDRDYQGRGIGGRLLEKLIEECRDYGIYSILAVVFQRNINSLKLHKKCGFREIGYRERVARDRFDEWQNTVMLEYRFPG